MYVLSNTIGRLLMKFSKIILIHLYFLFSFAPTVAAEFAIEFEDTLRVEFVQIGIPGLDEILTDSTNAIALMMRENGVSYYVKIDSVAFVPDRGGYKVSYYHSKDKVRVQTSNDKGAAFSAETIPPGEDLEPGGQAIGGLGSVDQALVGAGISTLQYGLVAALPYHRQLEKIYQAIAQLDGQIQEHKGNIEKVRVSLQDEVIQLDLVLKESVAEFTLPEVNLTDLEKVTLTSSNPKTALQGYKWRSTDEPFVKNADYIRNNLLSAKVETEVDQFFYDFGKESLLLADYKHSIFHETESDIYLEFAQLSADVLLGLDPFTGVARSVYEFASGTNVITGEKLSSAERVFAGLGIVTAGYAVKALKLYRLLGPLVKIVGKGSAATYKGLAKFLQRSGNGFELVSGSTVRKINFVSKADKNWGLTKKHLHKHFFGTSKKHALVNVDPGGNPDLWMQYMLDLVQRAPTTVKADGVIDIVGVFTKHGSGSTFKMGVRLMPLDDGTFDLITVLTKQ